MSVPVLSVAPRDLLRPLDVLQSVHDRQLDLCEWFIALSEGGDVAPVQAERAAILDYLSRELPLHAKDEDKGLFPLLRARCLAEDGVEAILAQLDWEHNEDKSLARELIKDLRAVPEQTGPTETTGSLFGNLHDFGDAQRRHVRWENAVLVPLARKRLQTDDLERLGRDMAKRRGIDWPEPASHLNLGWSSTQSRR